MIDIIVIIFGLIIGSFLTVCVYRIPLGRATGIEEIELEEEGEEIPDHPERNSEHFEKRVTIAYPPRSFCTHCGEQLKWWHNIPFFSWLLLRGKSACCSKSISGQYPVIELLSAFFAWLAYSMFSPETAVLAYAFAAMLVVISFIDIDYFIIPNVITYPGVLLGILFGIEQHYFSFFQSTPFVSDIYEMIFGILTGAGILLFISGFYTFLRKKQGLGMGDVKLLAMTGAFFGVPGAFYTIFVGSLLGSLLGISLILIGKGKWSNYLPFGPYLAVANLLYLFMAPELLGALGGSALGGGAMMGPGMLGGFNG